MGINTETVAFIGFLNKLAKMSEDDIHPFSTVTPDNKKGLFYDDTSPINAETSLDNYVSYPLIADYFIGPNIFTTWTEKYVNERIKIVVNVNDEGEAYVNVTSEDDNRLYIVIKDGYWYKVE